MVGAGRIAADAEGAQHFSGPIIERQTAAEHINPAYFFPH